MKTVLSAFFMTMMMIAGCNSCRNKAEIAPPLPDPVKLVATVILEYPGVYAFIRMDGHRGTCFVVEYKGQQFLITAKHMIRGRVPFILTYQGEEIKIVMGPGGMSDYDVAVMKISGAPHILKIAPEKIEGPKVYALGYITMTNVKRSTGRVIGNRGYITKAELQAGMSGGPLLNERGEVIGVNSSRQTTKNGTYVSSNHVDIIHAIRIMDRIIEMEAAKKRAQEALKKAIEEAKAALEKAKAEAEAKAAEAAEDEVEEEAAEEEQE